MFTTHTPVAAGNDEFEIDLLNASFGPSFEKELGLSHEEFVALGRVDPANPRSFGLTPLAIRMCRSTNGVSRKHGEVSRALWQKLWPEETVDQIPITHVTNGVHAPTWVAPLLRSLFEKHVGRDWQTKMHDRAVGQRRCAIPDEELWAAHLLLKERLVAFIRQRSFLARLNRGESAESIEAARKCLSRRADDRFCAARGRLQTLELVLKDPERLLRIINNGDRPVQFVFAGKAHPQDQEAKLILQQVAQWKQTPASATSVFLQNYDHEIARQLVQSVDVWLNVPRRPLEASGTSGEKVAMNGGLKSVGAGWLVARRLRRHERLCSRQRSGGDRERGHRRERRRITLPRTGKQVVPLYYDRDSKDSHANGSR